MADVPQRGVPIGFVRNGQVFLNQEWQVFFESILQNPTEIGDSTSTAGADLRDDLNEVKAALRQSGVIL